MMVIRRIINCAINEDIFPVEKNPFLKYKLKSESVTKTFLTEAELTTLEEFSIVKGSKRFHHRNMYVFAAYSGGMRISDVLQLKWENFDGERVLVKTQKTGSVISIKLPAKALQIIESYKSPDNKPSDYVFPILANDDYSSKSALLFKSICSATAYTNADLKTIAKLAEIDKPLNFHTSRHTWATRALKKGMRIEYVSKLMGHASIKTTQVYAKIVNADLDKAMEVFDEVLPEKKATSKSTTKKKKTAKKKV
jgi:integrase